MSDQNIFNSAEEAIKALKLDRRHKWEVFMGHLTYPFWYTDICSGCDGGGCHECGYKGKRRTVVPIYATTTNNETVIIKPK